MKIAICFPTLGDSKTGFAVSLASLAYLTARERPDIELIIVNRTSSLLVKARNELAQWALDWGADAILFLDADQIFPAEALLKLLAHDLPMVAANYVRKQPPHIPTAVALNGKPMVSMVGSGLEEATSIGLGLCLCRRTVLTAIEAHSSGGMYPLFDTPNLGGIEIMGEDDYFCRKVRDAGVAIHVDHALSVEIGHIGDQVYTFKDTMQHHGRAMIAGVMAGAKD